MLGKLIKHEFKSTGRLISLILLALMIITPVTAFYLKIRSTSMFDSDNFLLESFEILCVLAYVIAMIAAAAATVIILLMRFYQTMITKESYLTHTLPVKISSLIISKLFVACIWQIVSIVFMIASILLFTYILSAWSLNDLDWDMICNVYSEIGFNSSNIIIFLLLLLTSLISSYLKAYFSFALGHLFNRHPFAGFVIAYLGTTFFFNTISSIVSIVFSAFMNTDLMSSTSVAYAVNSIFILSLAYNVFICAVCYIGTVFVFKKKLNI